MAETEQQVNPLEQSEITPVPTLPKGISLGPRAKAIRDSLVQQWDATSGRDHDEVRFALKRLDDELIKRAGLDEETQFIESELNAVTYRQVPVPGSDELGTETVETDARGAVRITPPGPEDAERTARERKFASDMEDIRLSAQEVRELRRTAAQVDDPLASATYDERADKLERIVAFRRDALRKSRVQQHIDDGATPELAHDMVYGNLSAPGEYPQSIAEPPVPNPAMDHVFDMHREGKSEELVDAFFELSDREQYEMQQQKNFDEVSDVMLQVLEKRKATAR